MVSTFTAENFPPNTPNDLSIFLDLLKLILLFGNPGRNFEKICKYTSMILWNDIFTESRKWANPRQQLRPPVALTKFYFAPFANANGRTSIENGNSWSILDENLFTVDNHLPSSPVSSSSIPWEAFSDSHTRWLSHGYHIPSRDGYRGKRDKTVRMTRFKGRICQNLYSIHPEYIVIPNIYVHIHISGGTVRGLREAVNGIWKELEPVSGFSKETAMATRI